MTLESSLSRQTALAQKSPSPNFAGMQERLNRRVVSRDSDGLEFENSQNVGRTLHQSLILSNYEVKYMAGRRRDQKLD